jgi:hypothetical protein
MGKSSHKVVSFGGSSSRGEILRPFSTAEGSIFGPYVLTRDLSVVGILGEVLENSSDALIRVNHLQTV